MICIFWGKGRDVTFFGPARYLSSSRSVQGSPFPMQSHTHSWRRCKGTPPPPRAPVVPHCPGAVPTPPPGTRPTAVFTHRAVPNHSPPRVPLSNGSAGATDSVPHQPPLCASASKVRGHNGQSNTPHDYGARPCRRLAIGSLWHLLAPPLRQRPLARRALMAPECGGGGGAQR